MTDEQPAPAADLISSGPFRLFPAHRNVEKAGSPIHLSARAFDIFIVLVERAGEVVSKKRLIARVWPDVTVEESNLRFHIAALRRALERPIGSQVCDHYRRARLLLHGADLSVEYESSLGRARSMIARPQNRALRKGQRT
jgi:DNA-binding response OmpR family regulator